MWALLSYLSPKWGDLASQVGIKNAKAAEALTSTNQGLVSDPPVPSEMSLDNYKLSELHFPHLCSGYHRTITRTRRYTKMYSCKKYHILDLSFKKLNSDHLTSIVIRLLPSASRRGRPHGVQEVGQGLGSPLCPGHCGDPHALSCVSLMSCGLLLCWA